jgi:uncharacterized membrane protein YkoI
MRRFIKPSQIGILAGSALLVSTAIAAPVQPANKTAKPPHISLQRARTLALKIFPGKIIKEELEHENGGSGLRYSFDIRQGKLVHEVGIDAETGKLLENSDDSDDND